MKKGFLSSTEGLGKDEDEECDEEMDRDAMDADDKLCHIFVKYDKDEDGLLCYDEVEILYIFVHLLAYGDPTQVEALVNDAGQMTGPEMAGQFNREVHIYMLNFGIALDSD